jgi:hypothetical protein
MTLTGCLSKTRSQTQSHNGAVGRVKRLGEEEEVGQREGDPQDVPS